MENPLRPHDAGLPAIAVTPEVKVALSELQRMLAEDPYLQRMKARLQGAAYLNGYLKRRDILESKMAAARERANSLRKQIRPLNYELERVQRQRQTLLAEYQKPNQKPPKPKHVIVMEKRRDIRIRQIKIIFARQAAREAKRITFNYHP